VSADTFGARGTLAVGGQDYEIFRLGALQDTYDVARLPYTQRILLENLLRHEDGANITADDITALANWDPNAEPDREISFTPAAGGGTQVEVVHRFFNRHGAGGDAMRTAVGAPDGWTGILQLFAARADQKVAS